MTDPKIDPLLTAMLDRLAETGPTWHEDDCQRWLNIFALEVRLVYPPKKERKPRAKKDT